MMQDLANEAKGPIDNAEHAVLSWWRTHDLSTIKVFVNSWSVSTHTYLSDHKIEPDYQFFGYCYPFFTWKGYHLQRLLGHLEND